MVRCGFSQQGASWNLPQSLADMARKELQIFKAEDPCQASEIWFSAICLTAACGCNLPKAMFQKKAMLERLGVWGALEPTCSKMAGQHPTQHFPKICPITDFSVDFGWFNSKRFKFWAWNLPPFWSPDFGPRVVLLKLQVKLLQRFVLSPESSSLVLNIGLWGLSFGRRNLKNSGTRVNSPQKSVIAINRLVFAWITWRKLKVDLAIFGITHNQVMKPQFFSPKVFHKMKWTEGVFQISEIPLGLWRKMLTWEWYRRPGRPGRRSTMGSFGSFVWSFGSANLLPSRELTYPPKMAFWRWFSFSPGGICREKSRFSSIFPSFCLLAGGLTRTWPRFYVNDSSSSGRRPPVLHVDSFFGGGKSPFIYLTHWVWVCFLLVNQFTFYLGPNTTSAEVSKVSTRWSLSWPCWPGALKAPEFWRFFHAPNPGGDFDVGEVHHRFVTENTDLSTDLFPVKTLRIFVSHLLPPARANVGKRLTQGFFQRFVNVRSLLINKMHRFHISMIYTYFHSILSSYHFRAFHGRSIHPSNHPTVPNRSTDGHQGLQAWPSWLQARWVAQVFKAVKEGDGFLGLKKLNSSKEV